MSAAELKALREEINGLIHDFQAANDERLDEVKSSITGTADAIKQDVVERMNERLTELCDTYDNKVKELEERSDTLERKVALGGRPSNDEDVADLAQRFSNRLSRERGEDIVVSVEDYQAYRRAFGRYLRHGDRARDVMNELSVGSDPDGGYWVTPDMTGRIVEYVRETSPVRSVAMVEMTGKDALEGDYDLDEAGTGGWVGETETRSETDTPTIGEWRIPVHEQYAMPITTQKVLDDADRDIEAWLEGKVADKLTRYENDAFVNGTGVNQPRGFLTYGAGTPATTSAAAWKVIKQFASGASGALDGTNPGDAFINMLYDLKPQYMRRARWAMSRATMALVRKAKDGDGNYLWQVSFQENSLQVNILGHNVTLMEDMPDPAANSLSVALADWMEAYTIVDRMGIRILRDPFTTKGKVKFYTTKRVGGDVTNFDAIKIMKLATSV